MTRLDEVRDVLRIDVEKAIPELYKALKESPVEVDHFEVDWPCGIVVRVTKHQAQVIAVDQDDDYDEEVMELLEQSGRSFSRRYSGR